MSEMKEDIKGVLDSCMVRIALMFLYDEELTENSKRFFGRELRIKIDSLKEKVDKDLVIKK